ncbi:MAG: VOC family protein, partial [Gammaproteobacteria bacterium]|nr:VOC family protein [Gammaproteobacteria bacterium]
MENSRATEASSALDRLRSAPGATTRGSNARRRREARVVRNFLWAMVGAMALATAPLVAEGEASDAALAHVALNVADIGRSEEYYGAVLGFTRIWQYPPDSETPIEIGLAAPGGGAGLVLARLNDEPLPE